MQRNRIVVYLLKLGVRPHYKGFNYLVAALTITMQAENRVPMLEIYNKVADEYGINARRVERCIRTLIGTYCDLLQPQPQYRYTNSEFIYLCTMNMLMDNEQDLVREGT